MVSECGGCKKNYVYQTRADAWRSCKALAAGVALGIVLFANSASASPASIKRRSQTWPRWQTIIYQEQNAAQLATLKRLGVTAGKLFISRNDAAGNPFNPDAKLFARHGLRFYVENIATDFYSAYHRWFPNQPPDAPFDALRALHRRAPDNRAAFIRKPGLSDPAWLRRIKGRLTRIVREYAPYHPLYYSLADESGIADLAANWDFDLSPASLDGMRSWLRSQYGGLDALNHEWDTRFTSWRDVVPELTDAAVRQKGENFAAWADFKRWMDVAFARAVQSGTDAVHAADPGALAAIEGAQIPGWGGYNYGRLAGAVDAMEIYDMAENVEIARSLNPKLVTLVTISSGDAEQMHRLWRSVLRGMRGVILWDEHDALARPDGAVGPWGQQAAPVFHALRGPLGQILLGSRRIIDPVAILYSPASERTQWLLGRRSEGGSWEARGPGAEDASDDAVRKARRRFARLTAEEGLQPRYVTTQLIEQGALRRDHVRLLLLPHVIALPPEAAEAISRFVGEGGIVAADVVPGAFDGHSRRLPHPHLGMLFALPPQPGAAFLIPPQGTGSRKSGPSAESNLPFIRAGLHAVVHLTTAAGRPILLSRPGGRAAGGVALFRFRRCDSDILALQRNLTTATAIEPAVLHLPAPRFVFDLGRNRDLGEQRDISLSLDPVAPTILAVSRVRSAGALALLGCEAGR